MISDKSKYGSLYGCFFFIIRHPLIVYLSRWKWWKFGYNVVPWWALVKNNTAWNSIVTKFPYFSPIVVFRKSSFKINSLVNSPHVEKNSHLLTFDCQSNTSDHLFHYCNTTSQEFWVWKILSLILTSWTALTFLMVNQIKLNIALDLPWTQVDNFAHKL